MFLSPDGEWVGFFDGVSALWKVPIAGGSAVRLTTTRALFPRGATWLEDGTIVYAHDSSAGLWSISASGGEPTRLTSVDHSKGELEHTSPEALPGGRAVLFTVTVGGLNGGTGSSAIAALDLSTQTYRSCCAAGGGHDTWQADTWFTVPAQASSPSLSIWIASRSPEAL